VRRTFDYFLFPSLFAVLAVATAFVGFSDLFGASDLAALILSILWLGVAANAAVAAYLILKARPAALLPALAAGLSGILAIGYVLWVDSRSPQPQPWALAICLLLVLHIYVVLRVALLIKLTPIASWKVTLATVLPLWAIIQFWYQTQYAPTIARPQITLMTSMEETGRDSSGIVTVKATVAAENPSNTRVDVLASLFRIYGLSQNPSGHEVFPVGDAVASSFEWVQNERRYQATSPAVGDSLLLADEIVPITTFFEPKQTWSTSFVFNVDSRVHHLVRLEAELSVVRAAQLSLEPPTPCEFGDARDDRPIVTGALPPVSNDQNARFVCVEQGVDAPNSIYEYVDDHPAMRRYLILSESPALNRYYPQMRVFFGNGESFAQQEPEFQAVQSRINRRYPGITTWSATEIGTEFPRPS